MGHAVRALTDARPTATLLSVDGVGAFDYVSRNAMLSKLLTFLGARAMLPYLLLTYGRESSYDWVGDDGEVRQVAQAEGGEQGDPLMPLLFSLGVHEALSEVSVR